MRRILLDMITGLRLHQKRRIRSLLKDQYCLSQRPARLCMSQTAKSMSLSVISQRPSGLKLLTALLVAPVASVLA